MADKPFRVLPRITPWNEHFWKGGAEGSLSFLRCRDCATWIHPPSPVCPECHGKDLDPEAVSGIVARVRHEFGNVAGLVHALPLASPEPAEDLAERALRDVKSLYLLAREGGGQLVPAWFYEPVEVLDGGTVVADIVIGDGRRPILPGGVSSQHGKML